MTTRVADVAKARLSIAARRLGTQDPVPLIGGLIDRSFDLPVGDRRYGNNALTPGTVPLEHSFTETSAAALRLALEPYGPGASPDTRRQEVSREVRRLVSRCYGAPALAWFDRASEPFRGSHRAGSARFGAWFGAAFDENGVAETKAYYELVPGQLGELPANLRHASEVAMAHMPGLLPIFTSIACGRGQGAQRVYFYHRGDLRLLDLEPMMNALGVGHQLPSILSALGLILGGRFVLPEGSVIMGLRDTARGIGLKLDVLLPGVPDPPREMHGLIQMYLAQRPEMQRALRHWMQAMTPDAYAGPGKMSVVGVKVNPHTPARLSIYFRPVGYDQPPTQRERGAPYAGARQ
jgi:hypothetical protein